MQRTPALVLCSLLALAAPAAAAPLDVRDEEGFGESLLALTFDLPEGWTGRGRIAWLKPCSSSDMYEIVVQAASADGQSGLRLVPGHQIVWLGVDTAGADPFLAQMAVQQNEQALADMQAQFAGSNCHVGRIAGTADILARLILPRRPEGARVLATTPDAAKIARFRETFAPDAGGIRTDFDAVVVELAYPGAGGELRERLWLSWYRFRDDPAVGRFPGMVHMMHETVTVEGMAFAWAPAVRAGADLAAAAAALRGVRVDPGWVARVRAEQARRAEERRRIEAEAEARRRARENAGQSRHGRVPGG
jgi:hypothetical protein